MYLALFAAGALALLFFSKILSCIGATFLFLILYIAALCAVSLGSAEFLGDILLGSTQLVASIFTACAVIVALSSVNPNRLRRLLRVIWIIFIVLAVVETLGFKSFFDSVRDVIYSGSGRFVYSEALRDMSIYGRVRTTVFASEPSFFADTISSLTLMIFFLDPRRGTPKSWIYFSCMFALNYSLVPSFKMIFYVIASLVWQFWPRNTATTIRIFMTIVAIFAVLYMSFSTAIAYNFSNAWQQILDSSIGRHLASGSFYGRVVVGAAVGIEALSQHPLLGYGIGNTDGAYPVVAQVWSQSGAFSRFPWYYHLSAKDLMSNGFWWQWVFLGILGGAAFNLLVFKLLTRAGVEKAFRTIFCSWIVWYAGAAFVDPVSWFVVVVFSVGSLSGMPLGSADEAPKSRSGNR